MCILVISNVQLQKWPTFFSFCFNLIVIIGRELKKTHSSLYRLEVMESFLLMKVSLICQIRNIDFGLRHSCEYLLISQLLLPYTFPNIIENSKFSLKSFDFSFVCTISIVKLLKKKQKQKAKQKQITKQSKTDCLHSKTRGFWTTIYVISL